MTTNQRLSRVVSVGITLLLGLTGCPAPCVETTYNFAVYPANYSTQHWPDNIFSLIPTIFLYALEIALAVREHYLNRYTSLDR